MPVEPGGFVPGGVVQDEQLADAWSLRNGFGHFIQEELEHIGVHTVENQAKELPTLRSNKADHILTDMIAQVRHGAALAGLDPAAAWPRIAFDTTFISK